MFSAATRRSELNAVAEQEHVSLLNCGNARYRLALAAFLVIASLQLFPRMTYAQNPADHIESIAWFRVPASIPGRAPLPAPNSLTLLFCRIALRIQSIGIIAALLQGLS
jgi:hypothetical protein